MSENSVAVVELSVTGAAAQERAAAVRDWLLASGVIVLNSERDELWQPSEFAAGPAAATAFPDYPDDVAQLGVLSNSGVDVVTKRQVFHSVENYEPPACPSCATPMDEGEHHELIYGWLGGTEPSVSCRSCHHSSLIGDWRGKWTFQIAELGVVFNNWPPLVDAFVAETGRLLGRGGAWSTSTRDRCFPHPRDLAMGSASAIRPDDVGG